MLARADDRRAVTVSDRPAGRPVPPLARASARKRAYADDGTDDETSTRRDTPTRQPGLSDEEREAIRQAGADHTRRSRAGHGFPERIEDVRQRSITPAGVRSAARTGCVAVQLSVRVRGLTLMPETDVRSAVWMRPIRKWWRLGQCCCCPDRSGSLVPVPVRVLGVAGPRSPVALILPWRCRRCLGLPSAGPRRRRAAPG